MEFRILKKKFSTTPPLQHPDPSNTSVMKVNDGVGEVLCQHQGNPPKLYPCLLSPVESNPNMKNQEFIDIKLA